MNLQNGDKNSAAIYSDDNGVTWHRGASAKNFSSEAVVTEADGKLYMFVRRENVYYVSNDGGETWSDPQAMEFPIMRPVSLQLPHILRKSMERRPSFLRARPIHSAVRQERST